MNKLIIMFIVINSYLSFGQEIVSINFNTGDKELNTHLSDINSYAKSNMDLFRKDMSDKFGVTREQLDQLITKERKEPADVYYGYNLAQVTGKPFPTVIKMHTDKKGWGAIAKDLGIKPGSKEFHALKDNTMKKINKDQMKKTKDGKNKSVTFDTEDRDIDMHLSEVNAYAISNMDLFRKDLNGKFGATKSDLDRYLVKERKQPADVYYGYNLSRSTGKSFPTIMKMYTDKKGWGSIAKDLGIKPGSNEFNALKNSTLKNISKDQLKNYDKEKSKDQDNKMKQSDKKSDSDQNQIKEDSKKTDKPNKDK